MSNDASWSQASHTLTQIGQHNLTSAQIKALHDGVLTDVLQAVKKGTLPSRDKVRAFYGLELIQSDCAPPQPPLTPYRKGLKLNATKAVAMASLFKDGKGVVYYYHDSDLNYWFNANCQEGKAGTFEIVTTPKAMTFRQMAQSATGNPTNSLPELSRAIVAQGRDITPAQFEQQIIATQKGDDILLTNGYANFAFAKTGKILKDEADGDYEEVVMLYTDRVDDGGWRAYVHQLGLSDEWDAGFRLVLSNKN